MSISKDKVERAIYRSRRKFQTDLASNIATATDNGIEIGLARGIERGRAEGRAEGRKEGRAEGRTKQTIEIAGNMIKLGFSIDQIAAATGLSLNEIRELR